MLSKRIIWNVCKKEKWIKFYCQFVFLKTAAKKTQIQLAVLLINVMQIMEHESSFWMTCDCAFDIYEILESKWSPEYC